MHWQAEVTRILCEVVRSLLVCGCDIASAREGHAGKSGITRRREQAERIPSVSPGVPDLLIGIENKEGNAALGEVIPHCEPGLSPANNDGVNRLYFKTSVHFDFLRQVWSRLSSTLIQRIGFV